MIRHQTPFRKYGVPSLLTFLFAGIGLYFGLFLGRELLFLYALALPIPFLLLFMSWGLDTVEERVYPVGMRPDFVGQPRDYTLREPLVARPTATTGHRV